MNESGWKVTDQERAAERAVIACALYGGVDGCMTLTESDYYFPKHALIHSAAVSLTHRGITVDLITAAAELERRGTLSRCGGYSGLHEILLDAPPTAANGKYYAEIVRQWAQRRYLDAVGIRIRALVQGTAEESEDPSMVRAEAERQLAETPPSLADGTDDSADTVAVILAEPEEPTEWVIPGHLAHQERAVIVAGEGVVKSTLLRQFGICYSAGLNPWTGQRVADGMRVLFIDAENSRNQSRRAYRWVADRCTKPWMDSGWKERIFHKTRNGGLDLTGADAGWFRETAARIHPDIIILGPSYKCMRGDPKDDSDTLRLLEIIDHVKVENNCAILIESHAPHGSFEGRKMRPFGSARWLAWSEVGIGYKTDPDYPPAAGQRPGALLREDWRGMREPRDWPEQIMHGNWRHNEMPWVPRQIDWRPSVETDYVWQPDEDPEAW
jgi:hypothetical protein